MRFIKKIKFRGKSIETGEYVYSNSIKIDDEEQGRMIAVWLRDEFYNWLDVEPNSVVQLIGYDCNGNEVYDDDRLTDECGNKPYPKIFIDLETECSGSEIYDFGDKFIGWALYDGYEED